MPWSTARDVRSTLAVLVAVLVITLSTVGVAVSMAAASSGATYTLDDTTRISTQDAITEYDTTGVTQANVSTPALIVTIAEQASACNYETSRVRDARNDYLCLDYKEDVAATIRLHVPGAFWHPYVRENKASLRGNAPASLQPTADENATAVTARFDGATHAVYAIPEDVTAAYYVLEQANDRTKTWFGLDILGHETQWQTIDDAALSGDNTSARLVNTNGQLLIQYDATPNETAATWLTVPSDPGASAPVYRMTRSGEPDSVYVVSETTDAPPVRYKSASGLSQRIDAAMDEITSVDDKLQHILDETVGGFFGGGSS